MSRERRRLRPQVGPSLVPMIDVVFQLVVFFMVSTTFKLTPAISLALPQSSTAEPTATTELVVTIADTRRVYVNGEEVGIEGLGDAVGATVASGTDQADGTAPAVVIEGDRSVPYDVMVAVLDVLRTVGVSGARLRTALPSEPPGSR